LPLACSDTLEIIASSASFFNLLPYKEKKYI